MLATTEVEPPDGRIGTLKIIVTTLCLMSACFVLLMPTAASAGRIAKAPEIFFLGDSHLSFGAGRVFRNFFGDFDKHCRRDETWPGQARAVQMRSFGLMGVKSTALHTWVSRHKSLRKMVCVPDPKWPVNARLYGFSHRKDGVYVQLGKDPSFPFCGRPESSMEAVFRWGRPRLLVLYFMGNTITRWANSPKSATRDVKRFMKQLPKKTGCLFMTTSPVYRRKDNARRVKAQKNIRAAFAKHGKRCTFLEMLTPGTIKAIQGRADYFSRNEKGRVKDPYHPNIRASRRLLALRKRPLCRAVMMSLRPKLNATVR